MENIRDRLIALQDLKYRGFQASLMPTVPIDRVIGVRTPALRALARELKYADVGGFLQDLPHKYYEEDNLHSFIISEIKDFDTCLGEVERLLPYIDNWATCDTLRPKCFKKNAKRLMPFIDRCLVSTKTYTVRFGIGLLCSYFLDLEFAPSQLERVADIVSDEYYINMMSAWYFATALAKQWEDTLPYITEYRLPLRVHNKTIQKAIESFRITPEKKEYLRAFKRKS